MACVTLTWSSCGQTLESKSIRLGEACSIYIANTYPLVFPYRNGLFKGGLLSALSLKLMCGESKFWLVMLWFAFRIKSAYLEGSFHFMFSYDLQCYYQAQVSLCGPCGWKLLRENTQ